LLDPQRAVAYLPLDLDHARPALGERVTAVLATAMLLVLAGSWLATARPG
jgi:hypothetical protein